VTGETITPPGDRATVSVVVAVAPAVAFEIFTNEIDLWWRRGPRYRFLDRNPGTLCLETRLGGRLFESFPADSGAHVIEVGRVTVWEPPERLVLTWRAHDFSADESTEVDVRFEPAGAGTQVTVQHRGWASIRSDHPARHGLEGAALSHMIGLWWGDLMSALREFVAERASAGR
jgi:uncharacterized protein YndB with AHSA1/START domain